MIGFGKQNLELQQSMNSENPRVLRKNSKFANKYPEILDLLIVSETFCFAFSEEWVKRINIPKKKASENGIGLKEYTLSTLL